MEPRKGKDVTRAVIIYNPHSGSEDALNYAERLTEKVNYLYDEVDSRPISEDLGPKELVIKACQAGVDAIYIMGGDGTISEAINGLYGQACQPTIGILPFGTMNNLATMLGIPLDHNQAVEMHGDMAKKKIELGLVNDRLFISSITAGILPKFIDEVESEEKNKLGPLAYIKGAMQALTNDKTNRFRITFDGQEEEWNFGALVVATGNSIARMQNFFPEAALDDGKLTLLGLTESTTMGKLNALTSVVGSGNNEADELIQHTFTECTIDLIDDSEGSPSLLVDGDENSSFPLHIKVLPNAMEVFVPKDVQ